MPAPSLVSSCLKKCIVNAANIEDIGAFEYFQIKPVLAQIKSAEQLRRIELNSPQIQGDDAELWQKFIARDIPGWKTKNYVPKNPTRWYQVYCKYKKEQREEIERDQLILKQTLMGLQKDREAKSSRIEDPKNLPRVPRDPRMIANNGGVPLRGRGGVKAASSLTWTAGSKTKMLNGQGVLNRARKEAREITARSKLALPSQYLSGRAGQIQKAPAAMTRQYEIAAQPAVKILARKRNLALPTTKGSSSAADLEEREARLRRAMQPKASGVKRKAEEVKQTIIDTDEEPASADSDGDDLFDEPKMTTPPRPMKPMPAHRPAGSSPPLPPAPKPSDVISKMLASKTSNKYKLEKITPSVEKESAMQKKPASVGKAVTVGKPATVGKASMGIKPSVRPASSSPPVDRSSPESKGPSRPAPPPGFIRRKKEVDIFNRRPTKRPRV